MKNTGNDIQPTSASQMSPCQDYFVIMTLAVEHMCSAAFVCLFNDLMINLIYRPIGGFETHESV